MKATTVRVDNEDRFETGLLWKNPEITLPESRSLAYKRLLCQEKKMDKDPVYAKTYCGKMTEYKKKGFIRKLEPHEIITDSERLWYLSHFSVYNPNKPDKIRLVFNAAAESHGVSLNSSLSMGPDLNNPLTSVLWNFRRHEYAVLGDIKDMFHRVYMRKEDRVSQRFLWRGMDRDSPPDEYEMVVMVFGATCSPSSAQFVKNLNAEEFKKEFPEASQAIQRYFYVDDLLFSCPEEEDMKKIVAEVIEINKKGGFIVCNWMSNSKIVNESIPEELRSPILNEVNMDSEELPSGRVLGMWWKPTTDEFTFKLLMHKVARDIIDKKRRPTKREILQVAMSLYDPLGFLGHLSVKVKILLQDIWRSEIGWDDALSTRLIEKWNDWMDEVHGVTDVRIPRCYSKFLWKAEENTLHVFCDASEKAFAAVAFLRVKCGDHLNVSIVSSKTRVAPLKPLSIPRLELQAAVLGTRLAKKIQDELDVKIHGVTYWTDSMTVLRWIRSDARTFKPFISHRLGEILETTDVHQWRYVPTEINVADDATRDNSPSDITNESRWFNGPKFLYEDPSTWPKEKDGKIEVSEEDLEMKIVQVNAITVESTGWMENFSKFNRLVRVTAYVLRYINRLRKRDCSRSRLLSVEELRSAEMCIVKCVQRDCFEEEVECLNGGKEVSRRSRLKKLEPFATEDGVIRVGGRLRRCQEEMEFRNPAILDRKHHVTRVLIQHYHELCGHQGFRTVANELRQKYWILDGVAAVKQAFRDCAACKRRKVKPIPPKMSELPECRLESKIRPFTNTGMDYFGPITVAVKRSQDKKYGVIFTCLSTRAVHLEIAASLSTDSCIMAIQRFTSRRGVPANIYSDNGTNFKGTNNELQALLKELKSDEIEEKMSSLGIQWHFNPPGAPHMGGAWERLVGSVKRTMNGILKDLHPREELLHTVMCEAESILNSRPLTEVSIDPNDAVSLTPNHFLLGWTGGSSSDDLKQPIWGQLKDYELYLKKQWRFSQHLANQFWIHWRKEYLPTLTMRSKWIRNQRNAKEGDVVILVEDNAPRNKWPLGKVIRIHPGKDGIVRVVDIKTSTGEYRRPVSKICILQPAVDEVPSSGGSNVD